MKLRICLIVLAALAGMVWVGSIAPAPAGAIAATCSTSSGCAQISSNCKKNCPTVKVSPSTDVAANQWVTVNLSHFGSGDNVTVYYCSVKTKLTASKPSPCILEATAELSYPAQQVPIDSSGAGQAAVNVEADPPGGGDKPLAGAIPGVVGSNTTFFCDNSANPCAIEVVDSSLSSSNDRSPAPDTTAVVPLKFLPSSAGCAKADLVSTASDYSVQALLPALAPGACTGAHPSIPLNTANDLDTATQSLANGDDQVLFTTDPTASDVTKILSKTKHTYTAIPLAASATAIALSGSQQAEDGAQQIYSDTTYSLTPNQVAGLATYNYTSPSNGDTVACPNGGGTCSGISLLNSTSGFIAANQYGAFDPSESTGVTDQLLAWICGAPTLSYSAGGTTISDSTKASTTLTTSNYDSNWPIKSCKASDQLPAITSPSATNFALLSDPSQQAKYLRAFGPPPAAQSNPVLGIAPIDWSQADFYGFATAALQNAAGEFVAPSASSIDKALAAATVGKTGVVTFNYGKAVAGAYPMSDVIYAVVRTGSGAAAADKGVKTLLTTLESEIASDPLPGGYVALPSKLARVAAGAIATDLPKSSHGGGSPSTSPSTSSSTSPSTSSSPGSGTVVPPVIIPTGASTPTTIVTEPTNGSSPIVAPSGNGTPLTDASSAADVTSGGARYAIPALALLMLLTGVGAAGTRLWRRFVSVGR